MSKIIIIEDRSSNSKSTYKKYSLKRNESYQVEDAEDGVAGYEK
jgi:hypothetical protein